MQLGPYEVIRTLGGGGMSEALLARSPQGRVVVLKRPLKHDAQLCARLRDEGRIGARLFDPHLVETLELVEVDGLPILALGFVEGPTVDEIRKQRPLSSAAGARLGCHVAEALSALHGALGDDGRPMRAVHRDVTGRNIVVRPDGEAVLIDLGIARSDEARAAKTETGMIIGTIRYLAPELIDGVPASPASDLWALACVVFEAVTGEPAFSGTPSEVAGRITTKDPLATPAGQRIAPQLRDVLARLLAKDHTKRVAEAHQASALFRAAEAALGGGQEALGSAAQASMMEATTKTPMPGAPSPVAAAPVAATPSVVPLPPVAPVPATLGVPRSASPVPAPSFGAPGPAWSGASGPLAPSRFPAPPSAALSLELDRPVRPQNKVEPAPDRAEFYPKHKPDHAQLKATASQVAVWAVVLLALYFGFRYWTDQDTRDDAEELTEKVQRDTELLKKAMEDTAPACEQDSAAHWAYVDDSGATVVVDGTSQIPKRFRKSARCVRLSGR